MTNLFERVQCEHADAVLVLVGTTMGKHNPLTYPVVGDRDVVLRHAQHLVTEYADDIEPLTVAVLVFTVAPYETLVWTGDAWRRML
jgi:hypothetical protein